jgi:hypothetical protein
MPIAKKSISFEVRLILSDVGFRLAAAAIVLVRMFSLVSHLFCLYCIISSGWLEAPAHVDLSELKFLTTEVPSFDDDFFKDDDDQDTFDDDTASDVTPSPSPGDVTAAPVAPGVVTTAAPVVPGETTASPSSATGGDNGEGVSTEAPTAATAGGLETGAPSPADQTDVASPAPSPADRRRRRHLEAGNEAGDDQGAEPGGGAQKVRQILDVILFPIPEDCEKNMWGGCMWSALGVGVHDDDVTGGLSYCCSENAVAANQCSSDMMGRLMINPDLFQGEHRTVEVPTEADQEFRLPNPTFEVGVTGDYVMVLANCDDYGMDVFSLGSMEWKSVKGYLPGEMFGLMFFYAAMTVVYLVFVLWYWGGMRLYQDAAIPIQKFILTTISLGFLEFFFRAVDLGTWNMDGLRSMWIIWSGKLRVMKLLLCTDTFLDSHGIVQFLTALISILHIASRDRRSPQTRYHTVPVCNGVDGLGRC